MEEKNNKSDVTRKAKALEDILSGEDRDRTAGEYLESLRGEECGIEELEAIALMLTTFKLQWRNQYHFNDDYRTRILSWLSGQAGRSPIVRAACATLAGNVGILAQAAFGECCTVDSLKKKIAEAAAEAARMQNPMAAFLTWVAAPECYTQLANRIEEFLADREKTITSHWYLQLSTRIFRMKAQKCGKMFLAFHSLSTKNVTESTSAFKSLSQIYGRMEIMTLNLMLLGINTEDIITDNVKKNILSAVARLGEGDTFTELDAEILHSILQSKFSRKIQGSYDTQKFFKELIRKNKYSYHIVFQDVRKWSFLYYAVKSCVSFLYAGFLAFDPLDEENFTKWKALTLQHKRQLLEYECKSLYLHDLNEPYPEKWKQSMETVNYLLGDMGQAQPGKFQEAWQVAWDNNMENTVNALIQAGFMDIPKNDINRLFAKDTQKITYQYMLRYQEKNRELPRWITDQISYRAKAYDVFQFIGQADFPDEEKSCICKALLDAVWKSIPYQYHDVILWLFDTQPGLMGTFLSTDEMGALAKTLIGCSCATEPQQEILSKYTMDKAEWEQRRKEAEKRKQEQKELEELEELQDSVRRTVMDIISHGIWMKATDILRFQDRFFKPELARIATQGIKEMDVSIFEKIQAYAGIARAANCGTYLFNELNEIVKHSGDMSRTF